MSGEEPSEVELLLQAELDGELSASEAAALAARVAADPALAAERERLLGLSVALREERPVPVPAGLEARVWARVRVKLPRTRRTGRTAWFGASFGAGMALAAAVLLSVREPAPWVGDALVAAHVRALQPGHLVDEPSSDRHTVRPWFAGKLDFSPPVPDLAAQGYPLIGGRLDYLGGRAVAALAYRAGPHIVEVYIWPGSVAPENGREAGWNFVRWTQGGMVVWAVSDLAADELAAFARVWQGAV